MGLPILIVELEPALWCMPELPEPPDAPVSGALKAGSREALIAQWRSALCLPGPIVRRRKPVRMSRAWSGGDANELLRDGESLARLLLRRSWRRLPRRERKALRQRMRTFNLQAPAIPVPREQIKATAWLLAAMYWNGCRHPKALWCEPLHPATGVVRWLSGFDVVEQSEDARYILAKLAARVGWIEYESLKRVREMRDKRRVVAMLPELLQ